MTARSDDVPYEWGPSADGIGCPISQMLSIVTQQLMPGSVKNVHNVEEITFDSSQVYYETGQLNIELRQKSSTCTPGWQLAAAGNGVYQSLSSPAVSPAVVSHEIYLAEVLRVRLELIQVKQQLLETQLQLSTITKTANKAINTESTCTESDAKPAAQKHSTIVSDAPTPYTTAVEANASRSDGLYSYYTFQRQQMISPVAPRPIVRMSNPYRPAKSEAKNSLWSDESEILDCYEDAKQENENIFDPHDSLEVTACLRGYAPCIGRECPLERPIAFFDSPYSKQEQLACALTTEVDQEMAYLDGGC